MTSSQQPNQQQLNYFASLVTQLTRNSNSNFKAQKLNHQLIDKLATDIVASKVVLPQQLGAHRLELTPPKKQQAQKISEEDLLKNVEIEKMQILQKMKNLEREQFDLRLSVRGKHERERLIYRSEITQEDKITLKKLVKSSKEFEEELNKKNKEIKERQLESSLEKIKILEKQLEQKRERRRSQVIQNMKSMQLRSSQRKKRQEQYQDILEDVKNRRYLYKQLLDKQKQQHQEKQEQYQRTLEEIKNKAKIDLKQIEQHQKHYDRTIQQLRQKSYDRLLENSLHVSKNKSFGSNYYRSLTKQMMKKQKLSEFQKYHKNLEMKQKIMKYQEEINKNFKPKVSENSRFKPLSHHSSVKGLSFADQKLKGIQYLQIAKKLKDVEKQKQKRKTHAVPITKPEYKNYLKGIKDDQQSAQNKLSNMISDRRSMSNYESANKALLLAAQIQAKSKVSKDTKLVNSVKHKLQFLQAME